MTKLVQVPEDTLRALLRTIYIYSSGNSDVPSEADLTESVRLVSVDVDPIYEIDTTRAA